MTSHFTRIQKVAFTAKKLLPAAEKPYPHMTVRENLGFALKLRNMVRSEIEQRVSAAAATLGLEKGHVMQIDTPLNLYERPKNRFVAGFIGNPAMNFAGGTIEGGAEPRFTVEGGEWEVSLPPHVALRVGPARGRAVTMGIRPEDVSIVTGPQEGVATAAARLELAESLGNEIFVYASAGNHDVVARVSPQPLPPLGSPITLAFDMEKVHFFEAASGERIAS